MTPLDTSELQNSPTDGQDFPAVSNVPTGKQPATSATPLSPAGNQATDQDDTALEEFCRKIMYNWRKEREDLDNERLQTLQRLARLGTYATVDGEGFELTLPKQNEEDKERKIKWSYRPPGPDNDPPAQEFIVGKRRGFDEADADAIVALSAVRGWGPLNVHGNTKEKELLWLAAMDQGLDVANFTPEPDSDIWEKLKQRQAAKQANAPGTGPGDASAGPSVSQGGNGSPAPQSNPGPSGSDQPSQPAEEQEMDLSSLDKDQLTYLYERYSAEEKLAKAKNHPDANELTQLKEATAKALAKIEGKDTAPSGDAAKSPEPNRPDTESKESGSGVKNVQSSKSSDSEQPGLWSKDQLLSGEFEKAAARPPADKQAKTKAPEYKGQHRPGKGHQSAKTIIARVEKENKSSAPRHP